MLRAEKWSAQIDRDDPVPIRGVELVDGVTDDGDTSVVDEDIQATPLPAAASTADFTLASSETSATTKIASPPSPRIPAAVASPRSGF